MITGELKSKVDKLWTTFWNNGISNPLSVIEQISYLLFIKRLDDLELVKEKKAQRLNRPVADPTPRHIITMMVQLLAPGPREIICDPACGTGGFLVAAAEYLQDLTDSDGKGVLNAPGNREHFNSEMFHGFDFDATMLRIGSMNLLLHGIEDPKIEARDSLSEDHAGVEEAFTMILANPPFKGSVEKSTIAKDLSKIISTTKTELLFVALFLRLLKKGGRGAVIVPDGVLFGSSKAHKEMRQILVENHKLDGVISMPSGVFKPYAGGSTAILIFTKVGVPQAGADVVWFYDMVADGLSLDDKRQPVESNDIPDLLRCWQRRDAAQDTDRTAKAFFVPREEIAANGYDLSINRYKETEYAEVQYDPPKAILQRFRELEDDIRQDLDSLEEMLG
ncbi:MAG: N-6 DNA methylase [Kaiparowitsia implicata GSE-PSE-MK54-09C]|jgi:type I restriction enzyme M protein|nr:N-6 DNA methylase [Kaiparowitsia implicata GSE-PSE-MK54-09C]